MHFPVFGECEIHIGGYTIYAGPVEPVIATLAIAALAYLAFVLFILFIAMKYARPKKSTD